MHFHKPQEFVDLCEKLKETPIDYESVRQVALKIKGLGSNGKFFEFLTGITLEKFALQYGARKLQKEDTPLFEPYKVNMTKFGCQLDKRDASQKPVSGELDHVLIFGDMIWAFEDKTGKDKIIYEKYLDIFSDIAKKGTKIAYASVTIRDLYVRRLEPNAVKRAEVLNIVTTYLPVDYDMLSNFRVELKHLRKKLMEQAKQERQTKNLTWKDLSSWKPSASHQSGTDKVEERQPEPEKEQQTKKKSLFFDGYNYIEL